MPTVSEFSAAQYYDQIYNEGGIDIDQANSVLQQIEELAGDEVCCICYEPTADMISPFTCGHHLHRACVMGQLASGRTFACPLCRNTMRTESSNDRISTMPVVDNIERVIPEEASTLSSLLTDVVRPNEGSNAENRELLNRQTEILEDFNVTDDYSASELENPQDLINNAFERIINNIRETHPKGIFRRRMTNAQKEILRQERENLVNQLLVIMNRASPLYNITNDRTEILSNLSEQLTQDRAQIELLSRRLFHEVSRLDREITEQRDSQVSQADQVNQAENEQIQGLILALEEAVTSRFSEIERRLLDQESNNPQSASISNECDNQTSGVPEITRRFDELQSSVIDADNSMNNRLTEIERRLNQQTESTQNEQSQVVSETPLSNEKEAELNQKIDQLQSTVNRLLQQINRNTTNSASRSDRALDRPQPKGMLDRLAYVGSAIRSIASNPSMIQQPASNNSRNMRQVSLSNNSIRSRLAFDQEIRHAKAAFAEFIDLRYHDDDERKLTISLLGIDLALMSVLGSQTRLSSLAVGLTVLMTLGSSADRVINGNDNHTDIELRMKGMSRAIKVYLKSIVITTLLHYVSTAVYNTQNMDKAA